MLAAIHAHHDVQHQHHVVKHVKAKSAESFYSNHQATGKLRFVQLPNVQCCRLQQEFVNRQTGVVTWKTVEYVVKNKE